MEKNTEKQEQSQNSNIFQNQGNIFNSQTSKTDQKNDKKNLPNYDKESFMEKRRQMYLEFQKKDRNKLLHKSRQQIQQMSKKLDKQEEFDFEKQKIHQNTPLEDLINQMQVQQPKNPNNQIPQTNNNNDKNNIQNENNTQKKNNNNNNNQDIINDNSNDNDNKEMEKEENCIYIQKTQIDAEKIYLKEMELREKQRSYSDILVQPEHMIDIPYNLASDYYVQPRPNGERCLVIVQNQMAVARNKNGKIISKFITQIKNYSVLDCVFNKSSNIFYILDAIQYANVELSHEPTEFRIFWLNAQIQEYKSEFQEKQNEKKFQLVPYFEVNPENLQRCSMSQFLFLKDGIVFVNKQAQYIGGLHLNFLLFKDQNISMYPIEIFNENSNKKHMVYAVLELRKLKVQETVSNQYLQIQKLQQNNYNYGLFTLDNFLITGVTDDYMLEDQLKEFNLVKVLFEKIEIQNIQNYNNQQQIEIQVQNLEQIGKSSVMRVYPDGLSKLIFQYKIRNNPLKLEDIINSVVQQQQNSQNQIMCE
ncbi:hypothetical protein PPERSA_08361 [Pseudocohnilembus persalinus]|uniref:Snurportin-1 n=1 Tax=Pseudocohnilembus persalinus TaxID=266149 RepID=A0A0V0QM28_PSEPJ|nr:hypothetical protein PPERSA_08361 [Pseudocohnilembus persalinus]|eukprot:KRX03307.1 hypothetical protein PPERSA_08361 [Pseudocohnilembus persalinus]